MTHTISSEHLTAVISETGAELISLNFKGIELIWQGKEEFWPGKAPLLFPICGFLKEGKYFHKGIVYEMDVHGFAKDSEFFLINRTADSISLQLTESHETLEQYPFKFALTVTYRIDENHLNVDFSIENPSTETLPFSLGWHPGFNVSYPAKLVTKGDFVNRRVEEGGLIGPPQSLALNEESVLTPDFFNKGGIVLQKNDENVSFQSEEFSLTMNIGEFPAMVLWGQPGADFICLEPWHGMGDTINHSFEFTEKESLISLPPEETFIIGLSLKVE